MSAPALLHSRFPMEGERVRLEWDVGAAEGRLVRVSDDVVAGAFLLEDEGDALFVRKLVVEAPYRGYGLGSEAGRLLRDLAESGPWATLRAWAHPDLGLSVYFWVRMGLRPLHGEGPEGGIGFERKVR